MRVTRTDRLTGLTYVECELTALDQMHRALKGLADGDYEAEAMRDVLGQLVEGPLLQNAAALTQQPGVSIEGDPGLEEVDWLRQMQCAATEDKLRWSPNSYGRGLHQGREETYRRLIDRLYPKRVQGQSAEPITGDGGDIEPIGGDNAPGPRRDAIRRAAAVQKERADRPVSTQQSTTGKEDCEATARLNAVETALAEFEGRAKETNLTEAQRACWEHAARRLREITAGVGQ